MNFYLKIKFVLRSIVLVSIAFSFSARAEDARVHFDGDLMVHPIQISKFFLVGADRIRNSKSWDWENMNFSKPYKTSWSGVQALGPFDIQFATDHLVNQEFSFELTWNDPKITIGQFEIHDTIKRVVGGIPLYFHLDGSCSGMSVSIPGGVWKVAGKMRWDFVSNKFVVSWVDFQMTTNEAAISRVDIGQCEGSDGLIQKVQETIGSITKDRQWLEEVIRSGAGDWLQTSMSGLQDELLLSRVVPINESLNLTWTPSGLVTMPGGLIRVAGLFTLLKPGANNSNLHIPRTLDFEESLKHVKESGFILPKDSLTAILSYMQNNSELYRRIKSSDVAAFKSLMASRFMQFFIWPDLLSFSKRTLFYFDVGVASDPQLTNGQTLSGGGSVFNIKAPLLVSQWAPAGNKYLPYLDFRGDLNGQIIANVKDDILTLDIRAQKLSISNSFRKEYSMFRRINSWVAKSIFNSSAQTYIENTPVKMEIPRWEMNDGISIRVRDIQASDANLMIPLAFEYQRP